MEVHVQYQKMKTSESLTQLLIKNWKVWNKIQLVDQGQCIV